MYIAVIAPIAAAVVGGAMGSKSSSQTSKQELDPRMQALLYGSNGSAGLLGDVDALRQQQMAQGGLNNMQRSGLEMQRQTLMSPQYTQGYDQMRNMGSQLMGAGVAGNPFANGGSGQIGGGMGRPSMQTPMAAQGQPMAQMQPFQYQQPGLLGANTPIGAAPTDTSAQDILEKLRRERDAALLAQQQQNAPPADEWRGGGYG